MQISRYAACIHPHHILTVARTDQHPSHLQLLKEIVDLGIHDIFLVPRPSPRVPATTACHHPSRPVGGGGRHGGGSSAFDGRGALTVRFALLASGVELYEEIEDMW